MSEKPRSDRDKRDRIERLRKRLDEVEADGAASRRLVNIIKGLLDLLADEL